MDRKPAFALLLGLVTATGIWLLNFSTPGGLGLIDDAISYIAAARAMLDGLGFTRIWLATGLEPITHWPPGYPATLAALSFVLKIDPYRSARFLNMLILGGNATLLAFLTTKMTKSYWWGGLLSALFLANTAILRLHAQALSEPLYIFVSLLAFWTFYHAFSQDEKSGNQWLILTGFLTALSYITRYAALSLFATFIVAVFIFRPDWRGRLRSFGYFLIGALPPIFAWMLRNELVGGSATNRAFHWHPVTFENTQRGLRAFFAFLIPWRNIRTAWYESYAFLGLLLILITLGFLVWLLPQCLKYFFKPSQNEKPKTLPFITTLYIFGYLGSLLVSLTFFDAATPLNDRILSPIYVAVLMMLVYFLHKLFEQGKIGRQILAVMLAAFLLVTYTVSQVETVEILRETPTGFASWRWRESTTMQAIRELPEDVDIYTNQPPAVYFWTGRVPYRLWDIDDLHTKLEEDDAVLAYFFPAYINEAYVKALTDGLTPIHKSGLGNLYSK